MTTNIRIQKKNLIEPELSYKIVGALFEVYNTLGPGYSEFYYQKALAKSLEDLGLSYRREVLLPIKFHNSYLGRQRCDFLIEDKILVELKKGVGFSRHNIEQVYNYLRGGGFRLAILANVAPKGILFKRVVNDNSYIRKDS